MQDVPMFDLGLGSSSSSSMRRSTSSSRSTSRGRSRSRQPTPCCSGDAVACNDPSTVCCDDVDCATPKSGIVGEDDCIECKQGIPTDVCTEECFKIPNIACSPAAADCSECKEYPDTVVPCDDPACDAERLLEWDEDAVDELLKCCCNGSDHHHTSFTTAYSQHHKGAHSHSHHQPAIQAFPPFLEPAATFDYQLPLYPGACLPPSSAKTSTSYSNRSEVSAPSTTSFAFTSPAVSQASIDHPAGFPSGQQPNGAYHDFLRTQAGQHYHQQQTRVDQLVNLGQATVIASDSSGNLPDAKDAGSFSTFRCQWSDCSSRFCTREELVGHANVTHLLQATASAASPIIPTICAAAEAAANTTHPVQDTLAACNILPSSGPGSFDQTLRCLWDSCDASIVPSMQPVSDVQTSAIPSSITAPSDSLTGHPQPSGSGSSIMLPTKSAAGLQDQTTATLVKHLLQDHLHLPSDLLMQLSPGWGQAYNWQGSASCSHTASQAGAHSDLQQQYAQPQRAIDVTGASHGIQSVPASQALPASSTQAAAQQMQQSHIPWPTCESFSNAPGGMPFNNSVQLAAPLVEATHLASKAFATCDNTPASTLSAPASPAEFSLLPASTRPNFPTKGEWPTSQAQHTCRWKGCTETFVDTAGLMEHISDSHIGAGKSLYHCQWEGCERAAEGRGFNQRQKVMRHVRTHVGDKPFVCSECGRCFSESTTLAQHIRTHTNEKPFACPHEGCRKSFAIQSALTIHLRTHSGEKPFKCPHPGCDMSFAESSNLSKHIKTHQASQERAREGSSGWNGSSTTGNSKGKRKSESITEIGQLQQAVKAVRAR